MANDTDAVTPRLSIRVLGNSLGLFFAISYLLCILWGLLTPAALHMHSAWAPLLPGFEWLSLRGFVIGLVESYAYGWYAAVVFVPLFNFFRRRQSGV